MTDQTSPLLPTRKANRRQIRRKKRDTCSHTYCGLMCEKVERDRAVRVANELAQRLGGGNWQPYVMKTDAGWTSRALLPNIHVIGRFDGNHGRPQYACSLNGINAPLVWYTNPLKAFQKTVNDTLDRVSKEMEALFKLSKSANLHADFFVTFTQLKSVEYLRYPRGRHLRTHTL